ncbi:uncharacterized protein PAC_02514 [Phialocephala subalpina]|uniref:2EXR domain-containing protein n=1 Tax=Phialocephala subalpina TaxID=576137 RepID=A0A1L7WIP0_9HELO|nr:uncharacterized protein PAC_02514 [Phialocephala subalpina]
MEDSSSTMATSYRLRSSSNMICPTAASKAMTTTTVLHPPLESFTLFPKLPIELRIIVWVLALPRSRRIKMSGQVIKIQNDSGVHSRSRSLEQLRLKIKTPSVSMLGTCQESRQVALQYYSPQLGARLNGNPINIDYETNVIIMDGLCYFNAVKPLYNFNGVIDHAAVEKELVHFKDKVRNLVLVGNLLMGGKTLAFVAEMKNLETLTLPQELPESCANDLHRIWGERNKRIVQEEEKARNGEKSAVCNIRPIPEIIWKRGLPQISW